MLITVNQLARFWGLRPNGVLHVGAHEGEEESDYQRAGWGPVLWVEALPDKVAALEARFLDDPRNTVYRGVAWDIDGEEITFNVANNGQSSSVFEFGSHVDEHPDISNVGKLSAVTTRLDSLLVNEARQFKLVCLDIQGAELRALKGLGARLDNADWVYCEVNTKFLYQGIPMFTEVTAYLNEGGFFLADWEMTRHGWGDALYLRSRLPVRFRRVRRLARRVDMFTARVIHYLLRMAAR